jgi:hypothetical protein
VGTFESGKSRDGLYDLVGNVWEWTLGGSAEAERQSIVGGSYSRAMEPEVGASLMAWAHREEWSNEIGFRCVRDVTRRIYDRFLELLDSEWRSVRLRVLEDLVRLDPNRAAEALAVVQRRDPDAYVRVEAANRLLALRREDRIEIGELIRVLEPGNALEHRLNAASCLTFLAVSLEDSDLRVSPRPLLRILEGMPMEGAGRVPRDPMATVRVAGSISLAELYRTLAQLLVRIGEPEILDVLVRHARLASDARLRTAAAESLGYFNFVNDIAPGPVAAALVEVILDDPDASARRAALESLLGFDPRDVDDALLRVLAEAEEAELRVAAARQAVWIGSEAAVRVLGRVLETRDIGPKLRIACADSLLRMIGEESTEEGGDSAEPELQRSRDAALLAGLDALAPAIDHPDESIRLDAAELVVEILDDRRIERIAQAERTLRAAAIYGLRAKARGARLELWASGLEETVREGDEAREEIDRWRRLILEDLTRAIEGSGSDARARLAESLASDPAFATFRGSRDRPSEQYVSWRERLAQ